MSPVPVRFFFLQALSPPAALLAEGAPLGACAVLGAGLPLALGAGFALVVALPVACVSLPQPERATPRTAAAMIVRFIVFLRGSPVAEPDLVDKPRALLGVRALAGSAFAEGGERRAAHRDPV